ncbi:hypothetical protein BLNAU_14246 [Blattamonas nauphoetae]|uniref:Uncharacterized protein n=1 Tax=Blattamonas nauphoetae TaxID=2049346 RepID=A0ABQ9XED2_9EUKA|nr:hypothetical protein BLNAU_14246 [Blattamonas nauphoetae]
MEIRCSNATTSEIKVDSSTLSGSKHTIKLRRVEQGKHTSPIPSKHILARSLHSLSLSHIHSATQSPTLPLSSLPPPLTPPFSHTLAHPSSLLPPSTSHTAIQPHTRPPFLSLPPSTSHTASQPHIRPPFLSSLPPPLTPPFSHTLAHPSSLSLPPPLTPPLSHTLAHPSSLLPPSTSHTATQPHTRPLFLSPPSLHLSLRHSATHSPTLPLSSLPPPLTPPLSHTLAHSSSLLPPSTSHSATQPHTRFVLHLHQPRFKQPQQSFLLHKPKLPLH